MIRAKPLILLAEDEPLELRMLQTMLAEQGYETIVGEDGQQAILQAIQHRPDLVVLDLYLPNITGMAVLREIRAFGALARIRIIVLSGYADKEITRQARKAGANAVISKGQSPMGELLREIRRFLPLKTLPAKALAPSTPIPLSGAASLSPTAAPAPAPATAPPSRVLPRGTAGKMLDRFMELKAHPFVAAEILRLSADPLSDAKKITEAISRDKALAVRILKVANLAFHSAFRSAPHAAPGRIQNLNQAVTRLGTRGVRDLALGVTLVEHHRKASGAGAGVDRPGLWRHALACAVLAKDMAAACGADAKRIETAFLAGLLHEVGKIALDDVLPEEYPPVLARAAQDGIPLHVAEQEAFGIDHAEASRRLLTRWQMTAPIVEAATLQHMPAKDLLKKPEEIFSVTALVQVADALAKAFPTGDGRGRTLAEVPEAMPLTERLGLDAGKISAILGGMDKQVQDLTRVVLLHDEKVVSTAPAAGPTIKGVKALSVRSK